MGSGHCWPPTSTTKRMVVWQELSKQEQRCKERMRVLKAHHRGCNLLGMRCCAGGETKTSNSQPAAFGGALQGVSMSKHASGWLWPTLRSTAIFAISALVVTVCFLKQGQGNLCSQRSASLFLETAWLGPGSSSSSATGTSGGDSQAAPGDSSVQAHHHRPQHCPTTKEVAESIWSSSCYHVSKACVDQGKPVG